MKKAYCQEDLSRAYNWLRNAGHGSVLLDVEKMADAGLIATTLQRHAVEACKQWCRQWRRDATEPLTSDHPLYAVFKVGTAALNLEASTSCTTVDRVVTEWACVRETNKIPGPLTDALDELLEDYRRRSF